jgi:hypothetical protein
MTTGIEVTRELQSDGSVILRDSRCRFTFRRLGRGAMEFAIAKHLSETGKLIQIYSDAQLYESRKAAAHP